VLDVGLRYLTIERLDGSSGAIFLQKND